MKSKHKSKWSFKQYKLKSKPTLPALCIGLLLIETSLSKWSFWYRFDTVNEWPWSIHKGNAVMQWVVQVVVFMHTTKTISCHISHHGILPFFRVRSLLHVSLNLLFVLRSPFTKPYSRIVFMLESSSSLDASSVFSIDRSSSLWIHWDL